MAKGPDHRQHQTTPTPRASIKRRFATGNGRVRHGGEATLKDDPIFVLNSGSSSLKFGIYYRGASDEERLRGRERQASGVQRSEGLCGAKFVQNLRRDGLGA